MKTPCISRDKKESNVLLLGIDAIGNFSKEEADGDAFYKITYFQILCKYILVTNIYIKKTILETVWIGSGNTVRFFIYFHNRIKIYN